MRSLLDTPTQRRLNILEQLNQASGWINSNQLAENNHASLRTINNDISYLREHWYPKLIIETSKKNGIRLKTQPNTHISLVYQHILKNSDAFRLLEAVFFDTTLSIEKWGERLFISESSLYRITNDIAQIIKLYGLNLEKKTCKIIGDDEFYVRFFYSNFFCEAHDMTEWPFPSDKKTTIEFVKRITAHFDIAVDDRDLLDIAYVLNVSLVRQSQGFFITGYSDDLFTQQMKDSLHDSLDVLQPLADTYGVTLDEKVMTDLMFALYYHLINWDSEEEYLFISEQINQLLKNVRSVFDLTLTNELSSRIESYMTHLYLMHKVYPFPDYTIFNQHFYNAIAIRQLFPLMSLVIEKELIKLENSTNFPWHTDYYYVILYTLMIKWSDLPYLLEKKKEKVKVLVISDFSSDHSEFLADMIENKFGQKAIVDNFTDSVIFLNDLPDDYFDAYDIIVSTICSNSLPDEKLISIDNIPSDSNWREIRQAINRTQKVNDKVVNYLNKNYR